MFLIIAGLCALPVQKQLTNGHKHPQRAGCLLRVFVSREKTALERLAAAWALEGLLFSQSEQSGYPYFQGFS